MYASKNALHTYERGQSLVEMTLGLVVLLIILSGLIDIGRAYFIFVALEDSAGEAALYLSLNPGCQTEASGVECLNPNNTEFRARNVGGAELNWDEVEIDMKVPTNYGVGDTVYVEVSYSFGLITPVIKEIVGEDAITLRANASQIVITEEIVSATP